MGHVTREKFARSRHATLQVDGYRETSTLSVKTVVVHNSVKSAKKFAERRASSLRSVCKISGETI